MSSSFVKVEVNALHPQYCFHGEAETGNHTDWLNRGCSFKNDVRNTAPLQKAAKEETCQASTHDKDPWFVGFSHCWC